jgi:broad specificity phosphatase PhoE
MSKLRRLVLMRHGETVGNSKQRFHGSNDVALSDEGRGQVRATGLQLRREPLDLIVSSPLARAWESARLLARGASIRLDRDLREIDFGRWEGLTKEEIQQADPQNYEAWQARGPAFDFPGGEPRDAFVERVLGSLARIQTSGAANVLVVAHKGIVKTIARQLLGQPLEHEPELGSLVWLTRQGDGGAWFGGRRGSDPAGLGKPAA